MTSLKNSGTGITESALCRHDEMNLAAAVIWESRPDGVSLARSSAWHDSQAVPPWPVPDAVCQVSCAGDAVSLKDVPQVLQVASLKSVF